MPEPALSLRGLAKRYGAVEAVRDISLDVREGEIFGLIGPNGAGKSTTLECILGLCEPDSGSILVRGLDIRERPAVAREWVGAQLQVSSQPDAMTPRQALNLCASFYRHVVGTSELIDRFQLAEKADSRFASLSGGQRQRLALALAFVNDPKLVILDEPSVGLDPPARRELHQLIASQRSAGRTIVFSTHYLEEARNLCDRIALIDRGSLIAVDSPEALVERSASRPRVLIRTVPPLTEADIGALPTAGEAQFDGTAWKIESTAVNKTVSALVALADRRGIELLDLAIHKPSLDDVFIELTGKVSE